MAEPPAVPDELVERDGDGRDSGRMTAPDRDPGMTAIMPHAALLADAVASRDEDAAYTAWCDAVQAGLHEAGIPITAVHVAVAYCVATQTGRKARRECAAEAEAALHPWYDAQTRLQELIERWRQP